MTSSVDGRDFSLFEEAGKVVVVEGQNHLGLCQNSRRLLVDAHRVGGNLGRGPDDNVSSGMVRPLSANIVLEVGFFTL